MATTMPAELSGTQSKSLSLMVPKPLKQWYEAEAIARSEPGDRVNPSDLYRLALAEWANQELDSSDSEDE